jgi:phosphatidylserine/phosphatidylglycerophosphate/cardiolipin synthase-like enzyme
MKLISDSFFDYLRPALSNAYHSIYIASFMASLPNKNSALFFQEFWNLLDERRQAAIDIKILLDSGRYKDIPFKSVARSAPRLADRGFNVRVYGAQQTLHAKFIVIDQRIFYIGSHNLTQRSLSTNMELGILEDDAIIAGQLIQLFKNLWSRSGEMRINAAKS